jgi:cobalt-zinc-cadmium efflux system membrane fusion protein
MKSSDFLKSLIFPGILILLMSCNKGLGKTEQSTEAEVLPEDIVELRQDQIVLAKVEFGTAELRSMGNTLKVNGVISVAPQNQATICMPLGGFIKNTNLLPGNSVEKGQTLAVIENQDFVDIQQNFLEARNKLVFAEAEYKRHTDLYENDVYSEQNLQQVTMEYRNLKAQVKSLEQKLMLIGIDPGNLREDNISSTVNLTSPIKGFLKSVNINIGKYVAPTDILFEIVNSDKLFLQLTLFEKDADKVVSGQKAKFFINNESEEHQAIITQTGKSVSDDKTFAVYASVIRPCKNLMPGMYVNAIIEESDNQVLAVPSEAVVSFDDKDYIFIFEKNKVEEGNPFTEYRMIEIKKGVTSSGFTEIILPAGMDAGAIKIVKKGAYNLLSAKKNAGEMAC